MSDPKHPTNGEWELFDPMTREAPRGAELLILNEGGVLILCPWYDGAMAWGFKPKIPQSVKDRMSRRGGRDD